MSITTAIQWAKFHVKLWVTKLLPDTALLLANLANGSFNLTFQFTALVIKSCKTRTANTSLNGTFNRTVAQVANIF